MVAPPAASDRRRALAALLLAAVPSVPFAAPLQETLLRVHPAGALFDYRWKLLDEVLNLAADPGIRYRPLPIPEEPTQARALEFLKLGRIDVLAYGDALERRREAQAIPFDILHGLLGFRLLLVRGHDVGRVAQMDAQALRRLCFGAARDSQQVTVDVLGSNGFQVVAPHYRRHVYEMLRAGRFDVHPVALNEVLTELPGLQRNFPDLAFVPGLALFFPNPVYFWLRKDATVLAQRISAGLRLGMERGTIREGFQTWHGIEIAMLEHGPLPRVIPLRNPLVPAGQVAGHLHWWWPGPALAGPEGVRG